MDLLDAKRIIQKRKRRKRVGRGRGSGHGKTSCKGSKGEKSRSGNKLRLLFEGGQMPLFRRIPKKGFNNTSKKKYTIINIKDLEKFDSGMVIDIQKLREGRIIRNTKFHLKVLGDGELEKSLTVVAHRFSKSAVEKINKAGGEVKILP